MNGPQPISMGDIMAFCAMAAITNPIDRMAILYVVQEMDGEYLRVAMERQKERAKR